MTTYQGTPVALFLLHSPLYLHKELMPVLLLVHSAYPMASLVVLCFPSILQTTGQILQAAAAAKYRRYMSVLRFQMAQQRLPSTFFLDIDGSHLPLSDWCSSHPSIAADSEIAKQLADYVEQIAPGNSSIGTVFVAAKAGP